MASTDARDGVMGLAAADELFLDVVEFPGAAIIGKRACNDADATKGRDPRLDGVPVGQSATLSNCGCTMASAGAREAVMASAGADASDFVAGATAVAAIACEETRGGAGAAGFGISLARASFGSRGGVIFES